jgi:hypothetical protein
MSYLYKNRSLFSMLLTAFLCAVVFTACGAPVREEKKVSTSEEPVAGLITKWGFIDKTGRIVIPLKYDGADSFSCGRARVWNNSDYGPSHFAFIDTNGKTVFLIEGDCDREFREGRIGYKDGEKWGYKDLKGKVAIKPAFDAASPFKEGRAAVRVGSLWGYIDNTGTLVIPVQFDKIKDFGSGVAMVRSRKTGWCAIDKNGKVLFKGSNSGAGSFTEGIARMKNGRTGFADTTGKLFIPYRFKDAHNFSQGLCAAKEQRLWGFIDKTGNWVIEPTYYDAGTFSEGFAWVVQNDGMGGYVGADGKPLLMGEFHDGGSFSEGLAPVSKNEKWGFIDTHGKFIVKPKYGFVGSFHDGLAPVAL